MYNTLNCAFALKIRRKENFFGFQNYEARLVLGARVTGLICAVY